MVEVDKNLGQEDMIGNLHGYGLVLASKKMDSKSALYLIYDDSKG